MLKVCFEVTWIEPQLKLIKYACDLRPLGTLGKRV